MTIVAPPLGALLLESLSMQAVLLVDIITAALGVTVLLLVHVPQPPRSIQKQSVLRDMRAGFDYARGWSGLLILLAMSVLINFWLVPAGSLLPLLAKNEFGGGATQYGWMESAFGIGIVAGGLLLSVWGGFKRKVVTAQVGLIGIGVTHVMLGLAPGSLLEMAVVALFGAGVMVSLNSTIFAALQAVVAPDMQGRVFTLASSVSAAMSPLSLAVAGPLADQFGVRFWYVIAGVMCMLMGSAALVIPAVLNLEQGSTVQTKSVEAEAVA
jgi:DHA3 family macrolide efflux protein-like MFS transporter